jgi:DNA-binding beta-propeller fold protein YncE
VVLDSSNNLYIADAGTGNIYELQSGTNTLLNTWTFTAFDSVFQMAISSNGTLYAADYVSGLVDEYVSGTSAPIITWNGSQGGGMKFAEPDGIVFLPNGNILVSDAQNDILEEYQP